MSLMKAYIKVKKNKGCAGIDNQSIEEYEKNLNLNTRELSRLLTEKRYEPLPVKRIYIKKANGKLRPLGIPAVKCRVVEQTVLDAIQPKLESIFSDSSYGFRPNRSANQAIKKIKEYIDEGYVHVVDADIRDFFGTLNHQILMSKLREQIENRDITLLIYHFLKAGALEEGKLINQISGTPQGGVISPILANLYLTDFDKIFKKTDYKLVRYADDFVILCKAENQAIDAFKKMKEILKSLKLEIAEEKTKITSVYDGFNFLGHTFWKSRGGNITYTFPSDKSMRSFREKVKIITRRQQPSNIKMVIERLNPLVRGWGNYFRDGDGKKRIQRLDEWIRMRLRSFILKKRALTLNVHLRFPNVFFKTSGLVFLTDIFASQKARLSIPL